MASEKESENTAYRIITDYVRKGYTRSRNRIFIVHRLDRDTSGLVLFAKNERAKIALQNGWDRTEKRYIAVVHGTFPQKSGVVTSYLAENKARVVYSTPDRSRGKLSTTKYRVLKESKGFSLLEIDLITGRKNQIRVHMSDQGHPVAGDKKYGFAQDGYRRLALHAYSISFIHPRTGERLSFKTGIPDYLAGLVGGYEKIE
ncbi:MAG: RNA pseudouridine synthase [Candidatus Omnitrophica bacterium]|nr:RNA pseudouridine synthase [Candidatus Omnitrophota bacterium]